MRRIATAVVHALISLVFLSGYHPIVCVVLGGEIDKAVLRLAVVFVFPPKACSVPKCFANDWGGNFLNGFLSN